MKIIDESNLPLLHWLVMLLVFNAYWIVDDLWLRAHGHEWLTTEVREGFANGGWWGLALAAAAGGTAGIIYYHFVWQR